MPTETISVGTKPFESPVWTEVHSLPQFCFCPDVYNGSASGYGWVFSFLVHPHEVPAERQSVSWEKWMFSPHQLLPQPHLLAHPVPIPSAESRGPGHPVVYFIQINGRPVLQTTGKCEWCHGPRGRKTGGLGSPLGFSQFPIGILPEPHPIFRFCT